MGGGGDDFNAATAEVAALHDGFVFVDEKFAELVVGSEFDGIFVDDEKRLFNILRVKYITRRIFVEFFGGFSEVFNAGNSAYDIFVHFLKKVK